MQAKTSIGVGGEVVLEKKNQEKKGYRRVDINKKILPEENHQRSEDDKINCEFC